MSKTSSIPKRLKEARIAAGLSQKRLGIAAGIDEFVASARVNQYETGKHTPDYSILGKLAKVLGYPIAYFYSNDDILAEIIYYYGKLDGTNKRKLINYIKRL